MNQVIPPPARVAQRARIVDAARELFGGAGFERVTMAQVADRAGVARATVFNYFPSKHALVDAITSEVLAYWMGMLERALANTTAPVPTLARALFDHMGEGIERYHGFYQGVFREIVKMRVGLEPGGDAAAIRERAQTLLATLLARGQARGEITRDADPDDLAAAFDAVANGTIHHWLYDGADGSLRARMNRAAEIFLGPVAQGPPSNSLAPDLVPLADGAPRRIDRALPRVRTSRRRRTTP